MLALFPEILQASALGIPKVRDVDAGGEFSQIFIADTGASGHMSGSTEGMRNLRKCEDSVIVANGQKVKATLIGDKHGFITDRNGNKRNALSQIVWRKGLTRVMRVK